MHCQTPECLGVERAELAGISHLAEYELLYLCQLKTHFYIECITEARHFLELLTKVKSEGNIKKKS